MGWRIPWRLCPDNAVIQCLIIGLALCQVCCIEVHTSSAVEAVNGSAATLTCTFKSSQRITHLVSVDWSYRPAAGGPSQTFFYFSSTPHLTKEAKFKDRIRWLGDPARGDGTIQLVNATLTDNGTYTCSVKNPPDVHGPPGQVRLTVVPRRLTVRFTDVAVLMGLVLLPSAIIAPILLGRMWCCSKRCRVHRGKPGTSPIEVKERGDYKQLSPKGKSLTCCELYCQDSDFEEQFYIHDERLQGEGAVAETEC